MLATGNPYLRNEGLRLFHISEQPAIQLFKPRPSPTYFKGITSDVVFGISGNLLHNYLLPRDCPRVTYYRAEKTNEYDSSIFMGHTLANHVIAVENSWYQRIKKTNLYCYEFPINSFALLDKCAGYYISYSDVVPLSIMPVTDILEELLHRNVELRFMPSIIDLAAAVGKSSLNYSIIRLHNARQ